MDSKRRSLVKAMSWRAIAVVITATVGYLFTENAIFAVSLGVADSLIKIFVYYLHERAWETVRFGRRRYPEVGQTTAPQHSRV